MKYGFTEEVLKKYVEEIIELSRKLQEDSFDLCYNENQEISDIAKSLNNKSHKVGVLADRIRGSLD